MRNSFSFVLKILKEVDILTLSMLVALLIAQPFQLSIFEKSRIESPNNICQIVLGQIDVWQKSEVLQDYKANFGEQICE